MARSRPVESWDFSRAVSDSAGYDIETDDFLSTHYTEAVATDAARMQFFAPLLKHKFVEPTGDRSYLVPLIDPGTLDAFLKGTKSAHSRFSSEGRFLRRVVDGLRRELRETGRIRVNLLPGGLKSSVAVEPPRSRSRPVW